MKKVKNSRDCSQIISYTEEEHVKIVETHWFTRTRTRAVFFIKQNQDLIHVIVSVNILEAPH